MSSAFPSEMQRALPPSRSETKIWCRPSRCRLANTSLFPSGENSGVPSIAAEAGRAMGSPIPPPTTSGGIEDAAVPVELPEAGPKTPIEVPVDPVAGTETGGALEQDLHPASATTVTSTRALRWVIGSPWS